jgi:hypothetical protein
MKKNTHQIEKYSEILNNKKANTTLWMISFFGIQEGHGLSNKQICKLFSKKNEEKSRYHSGTQDNLFKKMNKLGFISYVKQKSYGLNKEDTLEPKIFNSDKEKILVYRLERDQKIINFTNTTSLNFNWFFDLYNIEYDCEIENYLKQVVTKKEDYLENLNNIKDYNNENLESLHFKRTHWKNNFHDHIINRIKIDNTNNLFGKAIFKENYDLIKQNYTTNKQNVTNLFKLKEVFNTTINESNIDGYYISNKDMRRQIYYSLVIPLNSKKIKYLHSKIDILKTY